MSNFEFAVAMLRENAGEEIGVNSKLFSFLHSTQLATLAYILSLSLFLSLFWGALSEMWENARTESLFSLLPPYGLGNGNGNGRRRFPWSDRVEKERRAGLVSIFLFFSPAS